MIADRQFEIERIHTEAVGLVMQACCQLYAAIVADLQSEIRNHCGQVRVLVTSKEEREASGLIESMKASLADDLPIDPVNAVESLDDFDLLNAHEAKEVGQRVKDTVCELLGVFN